MPINYQKQTYVNGSGATPLSAERLNHNENGTKAAADAIDAVTAEIDGRLSEAELSATFAGKADSPNFNPGLTSRGVGPGASRQITVKAPGDTTDGLFDWNHNSGTGYLFHLTMGANTSATTFAIAIGLDGGLGKGILLANKKTGMGIVLNQQSTITATTAYGLHGLQQSTLAPVIALEQYAASSAPLIRFNSKSNATAGQKLAEFTGEPNGVYTLWGHVSAVDGSLNWAAPLYVNGGVNATRANAGDLMWQSKMSADGTDIGNYRLRITANGAVTWSDGAGLSGPSLSRNGAALQLNTVFQFNTGLRWGAAALEQATVGAAGAAAPLPTTPSKYLKVQDSTGTVYVIPAYAAA